MNISNINLNAGSQSIDKVSHSNIDNSSLIDKNKQNDQIENNQPNPTSEQKLGVKQTSSEDLTTGYTKDQETGQMVWQLKDAQSGKVVKQLPPEYQLKIEQSISNYLKTYDKSGQSNATVQTNKGNSGFIINEKT